MSNDTGIGSVRQGRGFCGICCRKGQPPDGDGRVERGGRGGAGQPIPDVAQHSPHNNFGRLKRAEKRVMVFIRRDIRKQKLRQQTGEHPFGTIKHYDDGRHFLCRGKEKVTAEFALSALSYNIRRAIALCGGVQKLIERYRRTVMPKIQKIAEI